MLRWYTPALSIFLRQPGRLPLFRFSLRLLMFRVSYADCFVAAMAGARAPLNIELLRLERRCADGHYARYALLLLLIIMMFWLPTL